MNNKTLKITRAAVIAAIYIVLTMLSQMLGLAKGVIQFRLSESLSFLPIKYKEAIPGIAIGCFLSNILIGCAFMDVVMGTVATLVGAIGTSVIGKKNAFLGLMCPVVSNMIIIPFVLMYVYGVPDGYAFLAMTVGIGEFVTAGLMGWKLNDVFKDVEL